MSYRRVNKAKLIPASCSTLVSLWFIYPSTCANFVYPKTKKKKKKNPRSHLKPLRVSVLTAGEPADKHRFCVARQQRPPFILSPDALLSLRPICLLILLRAEWKSMARDTFGGPSACHITHQSVGSGYLGPVTGTVAERAAWLIRLFLQIADQWLWVGRWIFPFPLSLLLFFSPFRSPLVPGRDVCDVSMRWTGWLTRAAGEAGWLAGWEIVTHTGVWHGRYTNTHTHLFPPPHTFFPPFLCAECISRCHTDGLCTASMKTQPINDIRRSLFPPGRSCWSVIGTY